MKVEVKQEDGLEVAAEVLALAITKISDGLAAWQRAGMRREALVVLLAARTRVCKRDVEAVLDGIRDLKVAYCVPKSDAKKV